MTCQMGYHGPGKTIVRSRKRTCQFEEVTIIIPGRNPEVARFGRLYIRRIGL
jgi:hypothetical protein